MNLPSDINLINIITVGERLPFLTTVEEMAHNWLYTLIAFSILALCWWLTMDYALRRSIKKSNKINNTNDHPPWTLYILSLAIYLSVFGQYFLLDFKEIGAPQYQQIYAEIDNGFLTKDDVNQFLKGKGVITIIEFKNLSSIVSERMERERKK